MVLINGVDPVKRTFHGRRYTLEESGSKKTCLERVKHLIKLGYTYRILKKKDARFIGGKKYLLYVSDTIRVHPMDFHAGHPNPRPMRRQR